MRASSRGKRMSWGAGALLVSLASLCDAHPATSLLARGSFPRLREGRSDRDALPFRAIQTLRGGSGAPVPGVSWSQRQDSLMLKVDIPAGASLDNLNLAGDGGALEWNDDHAHLKVDFFAKLDHSTVTKSDHGGHVTFNAKKVEPAWWPKLTSGPKPGNVKVDWASWVDEDEDETEKFSNKPQGMDEDFDFGSMGAGGDDDLEPPAPPPGGDDDAPVSASGYAYV